MRLTKIQSLLLAVVIGLAAVFISLGLLRTTSPALAQGSEPASLAPYAQPPPPDDNWSFVVYFTDPVSIDITDLSGNLLGEGVHVGEVRCNRDYCSHKTQLQFTVPLPDPQYLAEYEYRFTTRQALDPIAERAVVAGTGTISSGHQKERFSFTATFQNNRDGTVSVTYVASRPDASFIIPRAPGTFTISSRR